MLMYHLSSVNAFIGETCDVELYHVLTLYILLSYAQCTIYVFLVSQLPSMLNSNI